MYIVGETPEKKLEHIKNTARKHPLAAELFTMTQKEQKGSLVYHTKEEIEEFLAAAISNKVLGNDTLDISVKNSKKIQEIVNKTNNVLNEISKNISFTKKPKGAKEEIKRNEDFIYYILGLKKIEVTKEEKNKLKESIEGRGKIAAGVLMALLITRGVIQYNDDENPFNDTIAENTLPLPPLSKEDAEYMGLQTFFPEGEKLNVPTEKLSILAEQEKEKVEKAFGNKDEITLSYGNRSFTIKRNEIDSVLAANTCPGHAYSRSMDGELRPLKGYISTWEGFTTYIQPSVPLLQKALAEVNVGQNGTNAQKIKEILSFWQDISANNNQYEYDMFEGSLVDYYRQPALSMILGGVANGLSGDCEDHTARVLASCIAVGIPEEDLAILHIPGHELGGVHIPDKEADGTAHILIEGKKFFVIEPTIKTDDPSQIGLIGDPMGYESETFTPIYKGATYKVDPTTGKILGGQKLKL